jgi:LysM repeat protein
MHMSNYFDDDDFWDGPNPDPDRTSQIERVGRRSVDRTRTHHVVRRQQPIDESIDDGSSMWLEPTSRGADRLGPLSSVDPRVLSIGAVALAVVLAVPLFGALGNGDGDDALRSVEQQSTTTVTTVASPTTAPDVVVVTAAVDPEFAADTDGAASSGQQDDTATDDAADEASADEGTAANEPPALSASPDCSNQYTAAAGDYWLRIANGTGTSLDSLLDVNEASAETPIYPGSTICLPEDASAPAGFAAAGSSDSSGSAAVLAAQAQACTNVYETVAGDYWLHIAEAAKLDLDELLELNDATPETPLYPGSEVCLPAGASGPAAPTTTATPTTAPPTTAAPTTAASATTELPATTSPTTDPPATTDAATTAPPTPPAPGEIEQIIRNVWPDDLEEQALRIAWRESSYNPRAQSYCCSGLFQIYYDVHASWLADLGIDSVEDLYDPHANATAAYAVYQRSGSWEPWRATAD